MWCDVENARDAEMFGWPLLPLLSRLVTVALQHWQKRLVRFDSVGLFSCALCRSCMVLPKKTDNELRQPDNNFVMRKRLLLRSTGRGKKEKKRRMINRRGQEAKTNLARYDILLTWEDPWMILPSSFLSFAWANAYLDMAGRQMVIGASQNRSQSLLPGADAEHKRCHACMRHRRGVILTDVALLGNDVSDSLCCHFVFYSWFVFYSGGEENPANQK